MTEWRDEGEVESTWARGTGHPPGRGRASKRCHSAKGRGALREASVGRGEGGEWREVRWGWGWPARKSWSFPCMQQEWPQVCMGVEPGGSVVRCVSGKII